MAADARTPDAANEPSREELDALALREHLAANPTPPSGPNPEIAYSEDEPRTVTFHNKDGSVKAVVTTRFRHIRKTYRLPRRSA